MTNEEIIASKIIESGTSNPMQYARNIAKSLDHIAINRHIKNCKDCKLCSESKSLAHGNPNAPLLVIGECHSEFNGNDLIMNDGAMGMLYQAFDYNNINREEIYFINAINCSPTIKTGSSISERIPTSIEVKNCKYFADYAIEFVQPKAILLLGPIAYNMFQKSSMESTHGEWTSIKGIPAMPTYHPSYLREMKKELPEEVMAEKEIAFLKEITKTLAYIKSVCPDSLLFGGELFDMSQI